MSAYEEDYSAISQQETELPDRVLLFRTSPFGDVTNVCCIQSIRQETRSSMKNLGRLLPFKYCNLYGGGIKKYELVSTQFSRSVISSKDSDYAKFVKSNFTNIITIRSLMFRQLPICAGTAKYLMSLDEYNTSSYNLESATLIISRYVE
jgi:hypothetical protein